jgi:hypothetical protein
VSLNTDPARRRKFIGCEIIYREACWLAARSSALVDVEFLRKGLHDLPTADMQAKVQAAIDAVDPAQYEAILLGYARCNDGLAGVRARQVPLVIPKAHDCISFFFGSRGAYKAYFDEHPGTYYMTTGWCERNDFAEGQYHQPAYGQQGVMGKLGLTESYEQMAAKYGRENADFIMATIGDWRKHYSDLLYLWMGVCDETLMIERARGEADANHWRFSVREGDWTLLRKLFEGPWDDDFVIVQPGRQILARNDEQVLAAGE